MKRIASALLTFPFVLLLAALPCVAQQFAPPVYYTVGIKGAEPEQLVTADFNNDGKLDLAVIDVSTRNVAVLLGNGDGTFQPPQHVPVSYPIYIATADLNGDGKADLVVLGWGASAYVTVLLGNGDGTFSSKSRFLADAYPVAVTIADFNGDGHPDLAVANSNNDQTTNGYVSFYTGKGDGTFTAGAHYFAGKHPWAVSAGDLNGDGHLDLVVADDNNTGGNNTLYVLMNNGDGTFHLKGYYQTGLESLFTSIADLNRDGIPDLVVASAFNQGIEVLLGNGDGTFAAPVFYSTGSFGAAPYATVVADFNMDGIPDIAVTLYQGPVLLFLGKGDGTFQPAVSQTGSSAAGGTSLVVGDFNHDGAPDVAASVFAGESVLILINKQ